MSGFFANNPFLRLIIPFLAGIVSGLSFNLSVNVWWALGGLFILLLILSFKRIQRDIHKYTLILAADIFLFFFALQTVTLANPWQNENFYAKHISSDSTCTFLVTADEIPVETEKFVKCHLRIRALIGKSSSQEVNGNLLGYFRKSGAQISPGDELIVRAKLLSPELPKNPFEYDYKAYLANNHIFHTFFADSSEYRKAEITSSMPSVRLFGLRLKFKILQLLKESGLSYDATAICAALLTGYDYEIGEDITESFSHSGTLHVLSVSGLHTGLIYICIIFILDLFDRSRKMKFLRYLVVITVLWLFALLTGFNAPVLRAVIMFSLLGFGKIFFRAGSRDQINILIVTAFMMLCYNPWYITDVGFQLSFLAVAGIFVFQPLLSSFYSPDGWFTKWLWQGTTTSFAATIATLPVTLFYFKQFPLWFFLTNLFVVPVTFLLLILSVFAMMKLSFIIAFMNVMVELLIDFIAVFNSPRWGYIDNIDFRLTDAIILTALMIILLYVLFYRSYRALVLFFVALVFWQLNSLALSLNAKSSRLLSFYHVKKEPAASVKNTSTVIVNHITERKFNYHVKPHLISFNYCDTLQRDFNFVVSGKQTFLFLRKCKSWPKADLSRVTHLCISNNFRMDEEDLSNFKNVRVIISDATNNARTKRKLAELCSKFDIALYDTQNRGAFIASLK